MRNLIRALRGEPVQLSRKQEAKMAAVQARADAMIAKAEADGRAAQLEAAQFMAGQANASVGSPGARPPVAPIDPSQPLPPVRDPFKQAFEGFRDAVGETFDDRHGIIDPGPGADLNRPPPELEDQAERDRVAAEERAAREQARAPYRADAAPAGRVHALRRHRRDAARGGGHAAEGHGSVRRARARLRRLPRARPLRPELQQRAPACSRRTASGSRACSTSAAATTRTARTGPRTSTACCC